MENDDNKKIVSVEEKVSLKKGTKKEKSKELDTKELIRWFKFYVLPIVSIGMLLVIVIFGIYPNVKGLFNYLDKVDELREQSVRLDTRIRRLKDLSQNNSRTEAYLEVIDNIVPEKQTEVVNFQEKIKNLGNSNNLKLMEAKAGETIILSEEVKEGDNTGIGLIEVPSQFSFQGKLPDIKVFLTELNKGEDFLVINEMKLTSINTAVSNQWTLDIIFVKYQFQEVSESQISIFSSIPESSEPNKEVLEFIKMKYGQGNSLLD
ncbi:hypothetical protein JW796_04435 [Candidatus Dojkabacteria bacterium]|nr:hypothetical protein [Candidatus Dojkabacteria bacterium]